MWSQFLALKVMSQSLGIETITSCTELQVANLQASDFSFRSMCFLYILYNTSKLFEHYGLVYVMHKYSL